MLLPIRNTRRVSGLARACSECGAMGGDQLRQTIGPSAPFAHVGVIEGFDLAEFLQLLRPVLHPGMRGGRAGTGRKEKKRVR